MQRDCRRLRQPSLHCKAKLSSSQCCCMTQKVRENMGGKLHRRLFEGTRCLYTFREITGSRRLDLCDEADRA